MTFSFLSGSVVEDCERGGFLAVLAAASGRASCEEMMAGSTGAPETVGAAVGALRAGGLYGFGFVDTKG